MSIPVACVIGIALYNFGYWLGYYVGRKQPR